MKRALLLIIPILYCACAGHVPAGQPALTAMNPQSLTALESEFDRQASAVRVILLLSPT